MLQEPIFIKITLIYSHAICNCFFLVCWLLLFTSTAATLSIHSDQFIFITKCAGHCLSFTLICIVALADAVVRLMLYYYCVVLKALVSVHALVYSQL